MWIYKGKILEKIPEAAVGFVYNIKRVNLDENLTSPMFYIGKKNFYTKKRKKIIESDWREYYGSSDWLKKDIKEFGEDCFEREILRICYSKNEMTYYETMLQINLETLRIDKNSIMPKKYYNLNILGKFYKMKEFSNAELKQIKEYTNTGAEEYQSISVTNGKETKYINTLVEDINIWLEENPGWYLGTSFKIHNKEKTQFTNGLDSIYIYEADSENFLLENPEWYLGSPSRGLFECVNNGKETKRIKKEEIESFLKENKEYTKGAKKTGRNPLIHIANKGLSMYIRQSSFEEYKKEGWELVKGVPKGLYIWVNNGQEDKKVKATDLDKLEEGWIQGRVKASNKNKIAITNGKNNRFIDLNEETPKGWYRGYIMDRSKVTKKKYVHNPKTGEMRCLKESEYKEFLRKNTDFVLGKNYSSSANTVYAINMKTLEKVTVSSEEYNKNKYLTSIKTKKVKIKKKNRIIFKGYLDIYLEENKEIPKSLFQEALRSETGQIIKQKGKYAWITEEKIFIRYI